MNCTRCQKAIKDFMDYCPFCGNNITSFQASTPTRSTKEKLEDYLKNNQYDQIFDLALTGDVIAKCFYIRCFLLAVENGSHNDEMLSKQMTKLNKHPSAFAKSVLGIYWCARSKKAFLSATNTEFFERGKVYISKAAEENEIAAMTMIAHWQRIGEECDKDVFSAHKLLKEAVKSGYPPAMYELGIWYYQGSEGITKKSEEGLELIKAAAFWGDLYARLFLIKDNPDWLKAEIELSLDKNVLDNISKLLNDDSVPSFGSTNQFADKYDTCTTLQDFVSLYTQIKQALPQDKSTELFLNHLLSVIRDITSLPFEHDNVEKAVEINADVLEAIELINSYTCPQHFLHFNDDLRKKGFAFDDKIKNRLMAKASLLLREKYSENIESFIFYSKAEKETHESRGSVGGAIFWIIAGIVIGIFWLPALFIGCALGIPGVIISFSQIKSAKKTFLRLEEDYKLINELLGYGYFLLDISAADFGYNPKVSYENKIPSILS